MSKLSKQPLRGVLREIKSRRYYRTTNDPTRSAGSAALTLSCGHVKRMKRSESEKVIGKTRCLEFECEDKADA
jgi:hypothetical protein